MAYRRRSSGAGGRYLSRVLLTVATLTVFLGVVFAMAAVYFASLMGSLDGTGAVPIGKSLMTPIVYLFEGGVATAGGGFLLMLGGGTAIFRST